MPLIDNGGPPRVAVTEDDSKSLYHLLRKSFPPATVGLRLRVKACRVCLLWFLSVVGAVEPPADGWGLFLV